MTELNQIYKCSVCGNIVEVNHTGGGKLVCCGKPMELQEENTVEASKEKHIPIVEKRDGEVFIKIGSVEHPMVEEHHIEWIELETAECLYKKYLKPGDKPEAVFKTDEDIVAVREYCNVHGLWKTV